MTYKHLLAFCVIALMPMAALAASWTQVEEGSLQSIRAITSTQDALVAAGNSGYTMHSTDGGETWVVPEKSASVWWNDAVSKNETIYMVGASGAYVTSEDDGQSWQSLSLGSSSDLNDIELDENYGYIVGNSGTVFYFANNNWNIIGTGVSRDLSGVHNMGDGTAWVSSSQGFLYYISSGGIGWTEMGQVASSDLNDVYFSSSSTGWIVGDTGTLKYTEDTAASWTSISVDGLLYQDLYAIEANGDEMLVVGDQVALYSNDGGKTWDFEDFSEDNYTFFNIHVDSDGTFWMVGTQNDVSSTIYRLASQGPEAPSAVGYYDMHGDGLNDALFYWLEAEDDDSTDLTYYVVLDGGEPISVGSELEYTWESVTEENHTFEVYAVDQYGNVGESQIMEFTYEAYDEESDDEEDILEEASAGNLIKTTCEEGVEVNDPCKAVYFYGSDGKRHAFPNEHVYFTWYTDFDSVIEVSSEFMSSLTLGTNVTYHPGTTLVKFLSVPTVYAVSNPSTLRPIASEEIAEALYGSTWNKNVDDIPDAFLGNYTFGEEIDEASDYSIEDEELSVSELSDIF
jgi:photosystem II stability/assembly factor-like uncharacterized protein